MPNTRQKPVSIVGQKAKILYEKNFVKINKQDGLHPEERFRFN